MDTKPIYNYLLIGFLILGLSISVHSLSQFGQSGVQDAEYPVQNVIFDKESKSQLEILNENNLLQQGISNQLIESEPITQIDTGHISITVSNDTIDFDADSLADTLMVDVTVDYNVASITLVKANLGIEYFDSTSSMWIHLHTLDDFLYAEGTGQGTFLFGFLAPYDADYRMRLMIFENGNSKMLDNTYYSDAVNAHLDMKSQEVVRLGTNSPFLDWDFDGFNDTFKYNDLIFFNTTGITHTTTLQLMQVVPGDDIIVDEQSFTFYSNRSEYKSFRSLLQVPQNGNYKVVISRYEDGTLVSNFETVMYRNVYSYNHADFMFRWDSNLTGLDWNLVGGGPDVAGVVWNYMGYTSSPKSYTSHANIRLKDPDTGNYQYIGYESSDYDIFDGMMTESRIQSHLFLMPYDGDYQFSTNLYENDVFIEGHSYELFNMEAHNLTAGRYTLQNQFSRISVSELPIDQDRDGGPDTIPINEFSTFNATSGWSNVTIVWEINRFDDLENTYKLVDTKHMVTFSNESSVHNYINDFYRASVAGIYQYDRVIIEDGVEVTRTSSFPIYLDAYQHEPTYVLGSEDLVELPWNNGIYLFGVVVPLTFDFTPEYGIFEISANLMNSTGDIIDYQVDYISGTDGDGELGVIFQIAETGDYTIDYSIKLNGKVIQDAIQHTRSISASITLVNNWAGVNLGTPYQDVDNDGIGDTDYLARNFVYNFTTPTEIKYERIFEKWDGTSFIPYQSASNSRTVSGVGSFSETSLIKIVENGAYRVTVNRYIGGVLDSTSTGIPFYFDKFNDEHLPILNAPDTLNVELGNSAFVDYFVFDPSLSTVEIYVDGSLYDQSTYSNRFPKSLTQSIPDLTIGDHTVQIIATDLLGYQNSISTSISVVDTTSPVFISTPGDITYNLGETGNTLVWRVSDVAPGTYNITIDGILVVSDAAWASELDISFNIDGLDVGTHNVIISLDDNNGNLNSDTSSVTVVDPTTPDTTSPTFISVPSDLTYEEGSTGNVLSWIASDENPDTYSILIDNMLVDTGNWIDNEEITFNIDGLSLGTHSVEIQVFDANGNSESHTITVEVVSPGDNSEPVDSTPDDSLSSSPDEVSETPVESPGLNLDMPFIPFLASILMITSVYVRMRRKEMK